MIEQVFYAEDADGFLRRWTPSRDMLNGNEMAAVIRGNVNQVSAASAIENLAFRLVKKYGEDENAEHIQAANKLAKQLRATLPENKK
ncbi:hypothetical protein [Roseibium sp. RKSG952]|uniref:hypothetical protein n=1 Tax=Roseibium sp. RKSG952 TaxID=2529384 RepID=UPI0012BBB096|nr:hypothetical protein [Roseibium sp. RKSG952]MTH94918.1 hypothetical protein [Roseibium sp. RKSG952]